MPPSGSVRTARQPRDTGFPEPFAARMMPQSHSQKTRLYFLSKKKDEQLINKLPVRNTTLPHPDADLSPNACIGQDDIHADLVMKRRGMSFLHRAKKPKKTLSHGIVPASASVVSLTPSAAAAGSSSTMLPQSRSRSSSTMRRQSRSRSSSIQPRPCSQPSIVETPPSPTVSKHNRDSFATTRRDDDETPPTSPDDVSTKSSRGLFRKLRRHH
ncbi:hypothetical protein CCM_08139 [Cordyceps militaris CM01]|uniref:Uncharacterized protein n=1 Tax=Cordyceps militaris (strain CM01) TaxID=983644 RepID=G3JNP6_CORMM|nr:uncharacterized protein CCM_08139 [Cordyceps militaris CM01]EGX89886.1 hypothetical protein CCM_08139 [Cordyceps militaris CM01]